MIEGRSNLLVFPQYYNVIMHPLCQEELSQLIHESELARFIAAYKQRIHFLSVNMGRETIHSKWFEVLKDSGGVRSIRFTTIRNIRILYVLGNNKAMLLLAFEEKQGHKRTEYSKYIDLAVKRIKEGIS